MVFTSFDLLKVLFDDEKPKNKETKTRKSVTISTSPYPFPHSPTPTPPKIVEVDEVCVEPVKGSVVYCDLVGVVEHSGIYIGNGKIVHLNGKGKIEIVSPESFVSKARDKESIYVSSNEKSKAIGSRNIAELAKSMVGKERSYNVILDNCHQFTSGCITGEFENGNNYLWMLKQTAETHMNATRWLAWDKSDW